MEPTQDVDGWDSVLRFPRQRQICEFSSCGLWAWRGVGYQICIFACVFRLGPEVDDNLW